MKFCFYLLLSTFLILNHAVFAAKAELNPDFYVQEYGAIDVRILNFNDIYKLTQSWGRETFEDNGALWAILTGKHRAFGLFNDLAQRPNYGGRALTSIMNETLPMILGQAYLPESNISTAAFEKKCHDRISNGVKNFGFLSADFIDTHFYRLEVRDTAGLGQLIKSKDYQYSFKSVVYQWIIFDSISKCNSAIEKIKQKYSQPNAQYFVDNVAIKNNYYPQYRKMLTYSGLKRKKDDFYLVKSDLNANGKLVYHLDYFFQAAIMSARGPNP